MQNYKSKFWSNYKQLISTKQYDDYIYKTYGVKVELNEEFCKNYWRIKEGELTQYLTNNTDKENPEYKWIDKQEWDTYNDFFKIK